MSFLKELLAVLHVTVSEVGLISIHSCITMLLEDAVFCHTCMFAAVEQKKIRKAKRGDIAFVSLNKRISINNAASIWLRS